MARETDLKALVNKFAGEIEAAVVARVNAEFAARFDDLRKSIVGGESKRAPRAAAKRSASPRSGLKAALKPCPICGKPNKARRFSYLCDEHRTNENQAKFKRGAVPAKKAAAPRSAAKTTKTTRKAGGARAKAEQASDAKA
jgi:hypothetical protein